MLSSLERTVKIHTQSDVYSCILYIDLKQMCGE